MADTNDLKFECCLLCALQQCLLIFRISWGQIRWSADFYGNMKAYNRVRLLSIIGNDLWQWNMALIITVYLFVNLTLSLSASAIGAEALPTHVYAFLPTAALCSIMVLTGSFPLLATIQNESQANISEMKKSLPKLLDADRGVLSHARKTISAQKPFGFQLGSYSFVSLATVQFILSESVSYSLLVINLTKQQGGT